MQIKRFLEARSTFSQAALLTAVAGLALSADAQAARPLYQNAAAETPGALKYAPHVKNARGRAVQIDTDALTQDSLTLELFDGLSVVAIRDRVALDENGISWIGHAEGDETSEIVLSARGRVLMGTLKLGAEAYDIVYAGNGAHVLRQTDPNAEGPHSEPLPAPDTATGGTTSTSTGSGSVATGAVIDVMVLYTTAAKNNAGGDAGIQTKIMNAIAAANNAYLRSQDPSRNDAMQVRLVHMEEVAYAPTGNMSVTLSDLAGTTDGKMDNVHTLRNQYGADQVALITAESNYCGIAYQMQTLSAGFAPYAFAVVHDDSVYSCLGNQTLAHEMGHNQGNAHNAEDSAGYPGIAPYSYGYRVCGTFRTVMSYACANEPRISNFANPNVAYSGQSTGIAGAADTWHSMQYAAPTVANFRASAATAAPKAPSNLTAVAASTSAINLSWTDNSGDEAGFKVRRSTDGVNWSEIAALGPNAASFSSTNLNAGTRYNYEVYAYNSAGNSPDSNIATATTAAAPTSAPTTDTTPPVVAIANPANGAKISSATVKIAASASDNAAVASMTLSVDGKTVSSATGASLAYTWNANKIAAGAHAISVTAKDTSGNVGALAITVVK